MEFQDAGNPAKVNFKIYVVTDWKTNNCNTYISNISKSKDNQAMKFGRLREYNIIKILLEKSYTKYFQDKDLNILATRRLFKIKYMSF